MSSETEKLTVSGEGPNTKITVMYRDAANYKKVEDLVLAGALAQDDLDRMIGAMDEGTYFLPAQVGLPSLDPGPADHDEELDHPWHTIQQVELTQAPPTDRLSTSELVKSWPDSADAWDC